MAEQVRPGKGKLDGSLSLKDDVEMRPLPADFIKASRGNLRHRPDIRL